MPDVNNLVDNLVTAYQKGILTKTVKMPKIWDSLGTKGKEGNVIVRELVANEFKKIQRKSADKNYSEIDIAALIITMGVVDKAGMCIFEEADVNNLLKISPADIIKLSGEIMQITQKDIETDPKV